MSNFWQNKSVCQCPSIMLAIWQLISAEFVETSSKSSIFFGHWAALSYLGVKICRKGFLSLHIFPDKDKRSSKPNRGEFRERQMASIKVGNRFLSLWRRQFVRGDKAWQGLGRERTRIDIKLNTSRFDTSRLYFTQMKEWRKMFKWSLTDCIILYLECREIKNIYINAYTM